MDMYILDLWPESLLSTVNIGSKKIKDIMFKFCKKIYKQADGIYITSKGFKKKISVLWYRRREDNISTSMGRRYL